MQFSYNLCNSLFSNLMNATEKKAWESSRDVVHHFLKNKIDKNYKKIVERTLNVFQAQGCNMSLKVHFLHSNVDNQGEKFHQDLLTMKMCY